MTPLVISAEVHEPETPYGSYSVRLMCSGNLPGCRGRYWGLAGRAEAHRWAETLPDTHRREHEAKEVGARVGGAVRAGAPGAARTCLLTTL